MGRIAILGVLICLISGCGRGDSAMDRGIDLRQRLLASGGSSFTLDISADYGDYLMSFTLDCISDPQGTVRFRVSQPESISGISGSLSSDGGILSFDDTVLHFDFMAEDRLSPISGPWLLLHTLRSGYIRSAGMEGELLRMTVDDSYDEDALQLDIWMDTDGIPLKAEVIHEGQNILSFQIRNFRIL